MDVITGAITSNSQLDGVLFNQSSSVINTNVASNWSNYDTSANATSTNYILSGCAPRVIRAQVSDDATRYKYLWTGQVYGSSNTYNHVYAIPAEGWNTSTKSGNNIYTTPPSTTQSTPVWNSLIQPDTTAGSGGTVTIISASQSHLFVSYTKIGTNYNQNYFLCSEFTRDDPWNTVSNGYPSWFTIGQNSNYQSTDIGGASCGTITRGLLSQTGADSNHINMGTTSASYITPMTRYYAYNQTWSSYYPFGLAGATVYPMFNAAANYWTRDSSKNTAIPLAEFKLVQTVVNTPSNIGLFAGGSITNKAPYIYGTRYDLFNNLDEIVIGGYTYTAIRLYSGNCLILVKQQ